MRVCNECNKKWSYPVQRCIFCGGLIKDIIPTKFTVKGITKVFVPSTGHKKVPYYNVLLKDENDDFHIKKTFKEFKLNQTFEVKNEKGKTIVALCGVGYSIVDATIRAIKLMGGIEFNPKDKILIKPNLVLAKSASTGIITNPLVVEGIIKYLLEKGISKSNLFIGEGSLQGVDTDKMLKKTEYYELCEKYGLKFFDLLSGKFINREIGIGKNKRVVQISELVLDMDLIIDVPVIKTHMQTGVSLGIKNMKGVINHSSRKVMHMHELEDQIAYLSTALPKYITIADGSIGLEGMGPLTLGKPANFGVVVAGKDPVAVDTAICHIIKIKVPKHIRKAAEIGLGEGDIKKINFVGDEVAVVSKKFEPADSRISPHPDIALIDGKPCSSCINSVWTTLHSLKDIPTEVVTIALGSQINEDMIGSGEIIAMGDCAVRALKNKGCAQKLKGCPPSEKDQKEFLKKWLNLP